MAGYKVTWELPAGYYKWIVDENNQLINNLPETLFMNFNFISNNESFTSLSINGSFFRYNSQHINNPTLTNNAYLIIYLEQDTVASGVYPISSGGGDYSFLDWTNYLEPISAPPEPAAKLTAAAGKILTLNDTILTIK